MLTFLGIPPRAPKPRETGIAHVLDKGLGLRQVEDMLESAGEYVDILKLGWGTGYVTQNIAEKVALYRKRGITACFGGTLMEVAIARNRFEEYCQAVREMGMTHVEFSTGVLEMELDKKVDYIRRLAKEFTVLAEVGSKDVNVVVAPYKWVEEIKALLDAGAWKVIAEARESGTVGLYRQNGEVRSGLVDEIINSINPAKLIFEAPQKHQQVWFLKQFGYEVNLGNIATDDIIPLETLRLGLRGDTMREYHLENSPEEK